MRLWREHIRRSGKHLLLLLVKCGIASSDYLDREDVVLLPCSKMLLLVGSAVILGFLLVWMMLSLGTAAATTASWDILDALLATLIAAELLLTASPIWTLDRPHVPVDILDLGVPRLARILAARIWSVHPTLVWIPILLHFLREVVIGEVVPVRASHLHVVLHLVISLHCEWIYSVSTSIVNLRK